MILRASTTIVRRAFATPFGGYKRGGLGRAGGVDAIKEYLQVKCVWITTKPKRKNPFVQG